MRWIYDACGNADLKEVAFAEKDVSAILEYADLSDAPRGRRVTPAGALPPRAGAS